MKYIYIAITLAFLFLCSCSSDSADTAGVLRYKESEIEKPFKLYVGSPNGGKEYTKTDSLKIDNFIRSSFFESYSNTTITFPSENEILVTFAATQVKPEKSVYKFENGSLFIYAGGKFLYFGEGNADALAIRQHYVGYKTGEGDFVLEQVDPQKNITADDAVSYTTFGSLKNMTSVEDTLVWCTRASYFN